MQQQSITQAAISDYRFDTPLAIDDEFKEIDIREAKDGEVDLESLRKQAEANALHEAEKAIQRNPGLPSNEEDHQLLTAIRIFDLLSYKKYRRGPKLGTTQPALESILRKIREKKPIELIISLFGSKVQNELKTFAKDGTEVDISETAALLRFYEITRGIQALYGHDVIFNVACDGRKYANSIGFTEEAGLGYYRNLILLAQQLGITDSVRLYDEAEFYPEDIYQKMERRLEELKERYSEGDSELINFVEKMRLSLALCIPQKNVSLEHLRLAFASQISCTLLQQINPEASELRQTLIQDSTARALRYIAMYDVVKTAGIMERIAPNAIRTTVHPKDLQFGLYAVNASTNNRFPHHVQGVTKGFQQKPDLDAIRGYFAADIRRSVKKIEGVTLPKNTYQFSNGKHPFMFVQK